MRLTVWSVVLGFAAGCGDDAAVPIDAAIDASTDGGVDPYTTIAEVPVTPNYDLDLLFVIDDSASMADKQANLAANFPNFVNVLAASTPLGLPNLHLGVVTTDVGTLSTGSSTPGPSIGQVGAGGCAGTGKAGNLQTFGAPVTGAFLSDLRQTDNTRLRNYDGTLADAFGTMARAGAAGCGFEQPLHAMRRALDNNPANAGFLRPGALLGVVFLTDEDDCTIKDTAMLGPESATLGPLQSFRCTRFGVTCATGGATSDAMNQPGTKSGCTAAVGSTYLADVAPYHDFLVSLKGDARKVAVGAIMGDPTPFGVEPRMPPGGGGPLNAVSHSCTYQGTMGLEVADPGVRMETFLALFDDHATWSTVCQQDLSGALAGIAQLVSRAIGSPCVGVPLADVDPNTPGPQYDCVVEDVVGATATPIAACAMGGPATCWRFETDAATCPAADNLKLVLVRETTPDPAAVTRLRCRTP